MTPNEILSDLRRTPFEPFTLILSDGSVFEIRHPDECLVLMSAVVVPVRIQPGQQFSDNFTKIDCRHILRVQYLPTAPASASANGHQPPAAP